MSHILVSIAHTLKAARLNLTNEKALQNDIANILTQNAIQLRREVRLDSRNIIDFLFEDGIGMEVKIKGSTKAIYRQLVRYAEFEQIKVIVLATSKAVGLPKEINGKSAYYINLSQGWL